MTTKEKQIEAVMEAVWEWRDWDWSVDHTNVPGDDASADQRSDYANLIASRQAAWVAIREALLRLAASPVVATPPVEDLIRRWNVDAILAADRAYGSLRPGEREGNWYAMDRRHASFIASWLEAKAAYAVDSSDTPKGSHAVR